MIRMKAFPRHIGNRFRMMTESEHFQWCTEEQHLAICLDESSEYTVSAPRIVDVARAANEPRRQWTDCRKAHLGMSAPQAPGHVRKRSGKHPKSRHAAKHDESKGGQLSR